MIKQQSQHIVLIGFMGTGKSTVGKKLAKELEFSFVDLDKEIEINEGNSIPEIFKLKGESYFRNIETETFERVLARSVPSVVSTGGGIILSEINRNLMELYPTILLDASVDEIYRRVSKQPGRPLLKTESDLKSRITELYNQRLLTYNEVADYRVWTEAKDVSVIVEEIKNLLSSPV